MNTNLSQMLLPILGSNSAWSELLEVLSEANDDLILSKIEKLLTTRYVVNQDLDVAEASLRMLGINLSKDLMTNNVERLQMVFDSISRYPDVSATTDWHKFVSFLIDTTFKSQRLWTADYQTFTSSPMGKTIQDGGNWYRTMKASLEASIDLLNVGTLDLRITLDLKNEIIGTLLSLGFSADDAEFWFNKSLGLEPRNEDPTQRAVRVVILMSRLTELFYQWAPVEEVLEGIYLTVTAKAHIYTGAVVALEPMRYVSVDARAVVEEGYNDDGSVPEDKSGFVIASQIRAGTTAFISFKEIKGGIQSFPAQLDPEFNSDFAEQSGLGYIVFKDLSVASDVEVHLVYGEHKHKAKVKVLPSDYLIDPLDIDIVVPDVVHGNTRVPVRVEAAYLGIPDYILIQDPAHLVLTSSIGSFEGQTLVLPELVADQPVVIKATYAGIARSLKATALIVAKRSVMEIVPSELELVIPNMVQQGTNVEVQCRVLYNDGSSINIVPVLSLSTSKVKIENNVMTSEFIGNDYLCNIRASYMEKGVQVSDTVTVTLTSIKYRLEEVSIEAPSVVIERSPILPIARGLYVVASATDEQVASGDPAFVKGWYPVDGHWYGSNAEGIPFPKVALQTGALVTPEVSKNTDYCLLFTSYDGTRAVSATKKITVYDEVLAPLSLQLESRTTIYSGSSIGLSSYSTWNNLKEYLSDASYTVRFIPSDSSLEYYAGLPAGSAPIEDLIELYFIENTNTVLTDGATKTEFHPKSLYFAGDLHGLAEITATYKGLSTTNSIPLVPTRSVVESIELEVPNSMMESSRSFVRCKAMFSDGTVEYVAPEWSAYWGDESYPLLQFNQGTYAGDVVAELLGADPSSIYTFLNHPAARLPIFENITTIEQLKDLVLVGAVVTSRKIDTNTLAYIEAQYFRSSASAEMLVVDKIPDPINTIVASRIEGPIEFSAGQMYASFALINTYQLQGNSKDASSPNVGKPRSFEMQVSNDWYIDAISPVDSESGVDVVDAVAIDVDGYLTPLKNVDANVRIRATFDDGQNKFNRYFDTVMLKSNTYLTDLVIYGQSVVSDLEELNVGTVNTEHGWALPYKAVLFTTDDTVGKEVEVKWHLANVPDGVYIHIDEKTGYLSVPIQSSDFKIDVVAVYRQVIPDGYVETISSAMTVSVKSNSTITEVNIEVPTTAIEPNMGIQLVAVWERRSGETGRSDDFVSPALKTVYYTWSILESNADVTLSDTGLLTFAASELGQSVRVKVVVTEGTNKVETDEEVVCPPIGFAESISVTGFVNIRDDSSVAFKASCKRRSRPSVDVTTKSRWTLRNDKGAIISVRGVNLDPNTGILVSQKIREDVVLTAHCSYQESGTTFEASHAFTLYSSYPRIGVGPFGINTIAEAETLTDRIYASGSARFTLNATKDAFGYFVARSDYGTPVFDVAADDAGNINYNYVGWDGANRPIGGGEQTGPIHIQKVYDNVVDELDIYRTNTKGFLFTVFTLRYQV